MSTTGESTEETHPSRRNVLRAGAAIGVGAFAAPVVSIIGAGPASAHDYQGDKTSGGTETHNSCHPVWPCVFVFFTDHYGKCWGAYCNSGSKSFKGLDDSSCKNLVGQKHFWNSQKWGYCNYGKVSNNGYGGWSGGWGGSGGGWSWTSGYQPNGVYSSNWQHHSDYDVQDFSGATNCGWLSKGFTFDPTCGQPICWTPPKGCNPPPHCGSVKFYCQDTSGGSLREVSCGWDGKFSFV